jgi:hypothetical protein
MKSTANSRHAGLFQTERHLSASPAVPAHRGCSQITHEFVCNSGDMNRIKKQVRVWVDGIVHNGHSSYVFKPEQARESDHGFEE